MQNVAYDQVPNLQCLYASQFRLFIPRTRTDVHTLIVLVVNCSWHSYCSKGYPTVLGQRQYRLDRAANGIISYFNGIESNTWLDFPTFQWYRFIFRISSYL